MPNLLEFGDAYVGACGDKIVKQIFWTYIASAFLDPITGDSYFTKIYSWSFDGSDSMDFICHDACGVEHAFHWEEECHRDITETWTIDPICQEMYLDYVSGTWTYSASGNCFGDCTILGWLFCGTSWEFGELWDGTTDVGSCVATPVQDDLTSWHWDHGEGWDRCGASNDECYCSTENQSFFENTEYEDPLTEATATNGLNWIIRECERGIDDIAWGEIVSCNAASIVSEDEQTYACDISTSTDYWAYGDCVEAQGWIGMWGFTASEDGTYASLVHCAYKCRGRGFWDVWVPEADEGQSVVGECRYYTEWQGRPIYPGRVIKFQPSVGGSKGFHYIYECIDPTYLEISENYPYRYYLCGYGLHGEWIDISY